MGVVLGATVLLLAGYVAAYYASVRKSDASLNFRMATLEYAPEYPRFGSVGGFIFRPIHRIDRQLRPGYWSESLDDRPHVPARAVH